MIYLKDFTQGGKLYEALNSNVRIHILKMLINEGPLTLDVFAKRLGVTNGAITAHIKKLEEAELIRISLVSATRGVSKLCHINSNRIIIDLVSVEKAREQCYECEIGIGQYCDFKITPTCGIVTAEKTIGEFDEPKYFSYSERTDAALLWFTTGYVEYIVPNGLKSGQKLNELQFLMEIASEAPGCSAHYPSDVHFYINDTPIGIWTTPGEYNDRRGNFTPDWWFPNLGQYGKQKLISVNKNGTFIDGFKLSDVSVDTLDLNEQSNIKLKIAAPEDAVNRGGLSLFGKGFGDYNNGILVKYLFVDKSDPEETAEEA